MSYSRKDRLLAAGFTVAEVARRAGTPIAHLYNILNKRRCPRPPLAMAIEAASMGVLSAAEILGIVPAPDFDTKTPLGEAAHAVIPCKQGGAPALAPSFAGAPVNDLNPEEQAHPNTLPQSA